MRWCEGGHSRGDSGDPRKTPFDFAQGRLSPAAKSAGLGITIILSV
jgi:hypothetical protein